jgi:hypothetical protein
MKANMHAPEDWASGRTIAAAVGSKLGEVYQSQTLNDPLSERLGRLLDKLATKERAHR